MPTQLDVLSLWKRFDRFPFGKRLFSRLVCFRAPYFGSIRPRFVELRPGCCKIHMTKRRAVLNHIGTVHAIAMCNLAELAAGTMTEVSIRPDMRWIPKGMTVEYLSKATSDVSCEAVPEEASCLGEAGELKVRATVIDGAGNEVFRAQIIMWLSARK
jgi:hypothetical protein